MGLPHLLSVSGAALRGRGRARPGAGAVVPAGAARRSRALLPARRSPCGIDLGGRDPRRSFAAERAAPPDPAAWRHRPPPAGPLDRSGAQRRFLRYEEVIEAGLAEELDLQALAAAAGVTRFQVIRDFKKLTGSTPAIFIRDRRLRRANRLIQEGVSLADAAFAAGFADQSHLSRSFRAVHGITPGMFRKAG
ncbi:MAG: hypothetical protein DI537_22850 [Stutzerimonas stutzeri]|nr:MAG: hypothetical protein DI537_22850 [Stutzerimonas stutzeri]